MSIVRSNNYNLSCSNGDDPIAAPDAVSSDPIFIVDSGLIVSHYNREARSLLAKASPFTMSERGFLQHENPRDHAQLRAAVQDANRSTSDTNYRVQLSERTGSKLMALITPIRTQTGANLMMFAIRDPEAHLQKQIELASRQFDFTPAEQCLAEALVRGRQLSDYALDRGVTMPTVRSQLRAILSKSGTSRQVEFVATVLSLPSL